MDNKKVVWIVIGLCSAAGIGYYIYDNYIKTTDTFQTISWLQSIKNNL